MNPLSLRSSLRTISVLVVHLLTHFCGGQSLLIGSPQPIVAKVGDDIILPCHLEPAVDVATKTLEWTRSDLQPRYVYVWRSSQDYVNMKNPSYKGRTSLFTDELKLGNISLKLSNVKPADEGRYRCYIPDRNEESFIELVVGSISSPGISLTGLDESSSGVVLQCESEGWYPKPEVLWLDGEGNVLSAGPTETVRGPDDLYTVSSRVTLAKRHGHRFTCRVQQNNINQSRETHIHVSDDFFKVQSRSSATTVGLAVSLAVSIMLILLLLLLLCKKKNMSKRNRMDKFEYKDQRDDKAEAEFLTEDQTETKQTGRSPADAAWSFSSLLPFVSRGRFHEEKQRRKELQVEIQRGKEAENKLNMELNNKTKQLSEEKNKFKVKLTEFEEVLKKKNTEMETLLGEKNTLKENKDKLLKDLETKDAELSQEKNKFEETVKKLEDLEKKNTELSQEKNKFEETVKKLEDLEKKNTELESTQQPVQELQRKIETNQSSDTAQITAEEEQTSSVEPSNNNFKEQNKTKGASQSSDTGHKKGSQSVM